MENKSDWSFLYGGIASGFAGGAEAATQYPTVTWKNCRQLGVPTPWTDIRKMYKGIGPYSCCLIPFFMVMGVVNSLFAKQQKNTSSLLEKMGISFKAAVIAGTTGTLFLNPAEVFLVQMTIRKKRSMIQSAIAVWKAAGIKGFFRGATVALCRNNLYSLGINFFPYVQDGKNKYLMAALGGSLCGTISQPFDLLNTLSKREIDFRKVPRMCDLGREIINKKGFFGFWSGGIPRQVRMTAGSVVVVWVMNQFINKGEK